MLNTAIAAPAATPAPEPPAPSCENCRTPLLGPHCHACGQPVKGLVRHFSTFFGDLLDTVFNLDARLPRTLIPLFARPGHLTREYLAGRRVRYVSPVRLFVFLSIATFFIAQLTTSFGKDGVLQVGGDDRIARAMTVADVERLRDAGLAKIARARRDGAQAPGAQASLQYGEEAIRAAAEARIDMLREAAAAGRPPPPPTPGGLQFGSRPWSATANPIRIDWLPTAANRWLNTQAARAEKNVTRIREDPDLFKDALLSAVPSTLFLLLPLFALLLKLAYAFKRRLYMEHLIVALHSHAFICLTLLLVFVLTALQRWLEPSPGGLHAPLEWLQTGLFAWIPAYLLIMQKRVYAQGWWMTLLKFGLVGVAYLMLLTFGAVATVLASLVWL